ncbi:unnamed protein product [Cuscuta epithymum]|uniref:Uncharacterized protein n=1 Tax=Cuscuta epithymum TaxID=186058 RepID=A0AAV0EI73_9ASTE|nr:unnamed protein product [Cuscuta epithymum]
MRLSTINYRGNYLNRSNNKVNSNLGLSTKYKILGTKITIFNFLNIKKFKMLAVALPPPEPEPPAATSMYAHHRCPTGVAIRRRRHHHTIVTAASGKSGPPLHLQAPLPPSQLHRRKSVIKSAH